MKTPSRFSKPKLPPLPVGVRYKPFPIGTGVPTAVINYTNSSDSFLVIVGFSFAIPTDGIFPPTYSISVEVRDPNDAAFDVLIIASIGDGTLPAFGNLVQVNPLVRKMLVPPGYKVVLGSTVRAGSGVDGASLVQCATIDDAVAIL